MKLPNGGRAFVAIKKLRDYCLNPDHPRGSGKARVFAASLGLTADDASELKRELVKAARRGDAILGETDDYGQRYTVDFEMTTDVGSAIIRSGWIILHSEQIPRLTTCYVIKRKRGKQ